MIYVDDVVNEWVDECHSLVMNLQPTWSQSRFVSSSQVVSPFFSTPSLISPSRHLLKLTR
jgi:hypothetical protein